MSEKNTNRWLVALGGVLMQLCLGTVYGWSVFTLPLMQAHGWTRSQVTLTFTIAIAFLGIAAVTGGYILDKKGARNVAITGGILFGIGMLGTGYGNNVGSLTLIYLCYGLLGGLGVGFGYITPIATLVKWFPDKRGVITGIAVMGFGFGALIISICAPLMISSIGISNTFYVFGLIFLAGIVGGAWVLVEPPAGWAPAGWTPKVGGSSQVVGMTLNEAAGTKYFYLLWAMLFFNITAGIAIISQASPMAQELMGAGMSAVDKAKQAGVILSIFALVNGLGRLLWASLSDKIGRRTVFMLLFSTQAMAFFLLSGLNNLVLFTVLVSYIYACYGGGFATMPAYAADIFGTKYVGRIYGWIITAWSAAGIVGPMLFAKLREVTGNYSSALLYTAIVLAVVLILPMLATPQKTKLKEVEV